MSKRNNRYRGLRRRRDRIEAHTDRVNREQLSFEENKDELVHFWLIVGDDVPTAKFVVEFRLLEEITFREFKEKLLDMVSGLYE